jgi:uncharacterized membrane protein
MKKVMIILSVLAAFTSSGAVAAPALKCGGTEPFWSIEVKEKHITVDISGELKQNYFGLSVQEAAGMSAGTAFKIKGSRDRGAKRVELSVIRDSAGACSDGMSEESYPYQVLAEVEGILLSGCCR